MAPHKKFPFPITNIVVFAELLFMLFLGPFSTPTLTNTKIIIFYKSHFFFSRSRFLGEFLRSEFSQKPTFKPAFTDYEVVFFSGFLQVGFVEKYETCEIESS